MALDGRGYKVRVLVVEESAQLRGERQRGTKDGGRYLGDAGEGFSLAKGTEDLAGEGCLGRQRTSTCRAGGVGRSDRSYE